jgi:Rps23 Pro-64 3,4-dihydroxylase Tpa1-like proline 4-hydroxylase
LRRYNLLELVPPLFNRLTVFDPRVPHGVPVVEGTRDPREGRLVLHGWFQVGPAGICLFS